MGNLRALKKGTWSDLAFSLVALSSLTQLGACASKKVQPVEEPTPMSADTDVETAAPTETLSSVGPMTEGPTSMDELPVEKPTVSMKKRTASGPRRAYSFSKTPKIAAAPFKSKDGRWMNAFYFVRGSNETWESLSQSLYGRPDRAGMLKSWNSSTTIEPGAVVYYNSALRPEDSQEMKVFAADFGYGLETITIQSGDWMSKIGQARYGDVRTWREIAALNPGITNPDLIEVGQTLQIQPVQIDSQAVLSKLIEQVQTAATEIPTPNAPSEESAAVGGTLDQTTAAVDSTPPAPEAAPIEQIEQAPPPVEQAETPPPAPESVPAKTELKEPKKATAPPVTYAMIAASLLAALGAAGVLVQRRIKAKRAALQALDNVAQFDVNRNAS